jgi:hypothetical protein
LRRLIDKTNHLPDYNSIRHEFDFRFALYFKRSDAVVDEHGLHAWKLQGIYHYRIQPWLEYGGGAGYILFGGEAPPGGAFSRGTVIPVSVRLAASAVPKLPQPFRGLVFRYERTYITEGLNGAILGNTQSLYSTTHEWNNSYTLEYHIWRYGQ